MNILRDLARQGLGFLMPASRDGAPGRFAVFLRDEEQRTLRSAAYVRFVFVGLLLVLELVPVVLGMARLPADLYPFLLKLGFLPVGFVQLWLARSGRNRMWIKYVLLAVDVAWLAFAQIVPNPWEWAPGSRDFVLNAAQAYRQQDLKWLWLFFIWVAFNFSATYVRAFAAYVVAAWILQPVWLSTLPGLELVWNPMTTLGQAPPSLNSVVIDLSLAVDNILVTLFMAIGFSFVAASHHGLIVSFFAAEERKGALSRYFSPNLLHRLDRPQERVRTRAAVLFTDMRGFSTFAEERRPDEVLDLLQAFHALVEAEIFARDGTLEKYIGDAVMAVFGAPEPRPDDADRALATALAALEAVDAWNRDRLVAGSPVVTLGIGLDFGDVVGGVIGRDRNMAYAVVGATVNLASRLEGLTRDFDADIVMSDRFYQALSPQMCAAIPHAERRDTARIRNMQDQTVWIVRRP